MGFSGPTNAVMLVTGTPSLPGSGGTVAVYNPSASNPVRLGGNNITVNGGGGPGPTITPPTYSGNLTATTNTLTRASGSWLADRFVYGMVLEINGLPAWTVTGVSATTLLVSGAALTAGTMTGVSLIGFAPSPLVVYGSTSQDGIWYSGDPHTMTQRDFGSKPFPTQLGNGTPDFILPVADPFRTAGNNVIDAHNAFPIAALPAPGVTTPNAGVPEGQVPSVGLILYGGPGNNTIYGSQANDFIAGGSGNTTVWGERGQNQILGSDGVNVDVITRAVSFPTVNTSVFPDVDPLLCGPNACNNTIFGNTPGAGEVTTDRFGDYNNLIFGAMGVVLQDTQESTVGVLGATIVIKGLTLVSNVGTGHATLTCPASTQCFALNEAGLAVADTFGFLGSSTTILSVDSSLTFATLSRNALNGATAGNLTVTVNPLRTVTAKLTASAMTLNGIPVATLTCASACFNLSDVGLDVADFGNVNLSAGTVIAAFISATQVELSRDAVIGTVNSLAVTVGPPHGYCRPTGNQSNSVYCGPSGITPWGDSRIEKLQTTGDILSITSAQVQNHGNDTLYGSGGDNVLVGGDGNNNIQGGPGRNLIIAGSVALDRTSHLFNYTNPRFQDLIGTQMYNYCTYGTCGTGNGAPSNGYAFGQSMNDGIPQCDPTGHAWWGDFLSNAGNAGTPGTPSCTAGNGAIGIMLSAPLSTPGWPVFLQDSAYKGADYIAGGSGSGYIFGESNDNIIQAHGSIDIVYPTSASNPVSVANQAATGSETSGDPYAGAAGCPFAGYYLGDRVGACRTYVGDVLPVDPTQPLRVNPSVDNAGPNYSATGSWTFGTNAAGQATVTRTDGLSWTDFGFGVGQTLFVGIKEIGVVTALTFDPLAGVSVLTLTGSPTSVTACTPASCTLWAGDGEAYVEGGRGNNTIYANQGQNDIVGGNSDLFSLKLASPSSYLLGLRASGSNLIFGGSGNNIGYEDCTNPQFVGINASRECGVQTNSHDGWSGPSTRTRPATA